MSNPPEKIWDVIVIGGGPAGMMAAGRAAERGGTVLIVEKNDSLGKKLLITGGGRCNVTNAEPDTRKLLAKFKDSDKYLFSAFSQWGVSDTLDFFHARNMDTKVEKELRVFPVSDSAQSVWDVLVENLKKHKVEILSNSQVAELAKTGDMITGVRLKNKSVISGKSIIVATGGISRPETGSTGDGYAWLKDMGHTVIQPTPSLVPVAIAAPWIKKLAGVTLTDIKLTLFQNNEKQDSAKGKLLFTHVGISGPTVLNMSKDIGELLKYGDVIVSLDLLPAQDYGMLNASLQQLFKDHDKKKLQNALSHLIPTALANTVLEVSGINPDTACNSVTREDRLKLVQTLKGIPLPVSHLLGVEKAIITSGGVLLDEVDFKTMRSRIHANIYIVGDMLNIDRPSGGYSLQLCWTTGFVAGNSVEF